MKNHLEEEEEWLLLLAMLLLAVILFILQYERCYSEIEYCEPYLILRT